MSHDGGQTCPCVESHRPKVVELDVHHVLPVFLGGLDVADNRVWVCPNTHRATHELLRLYLYAKAAPHGDVLATYPRMARELAADGYRRHTEAT